jgi:hypothetical protein
LDAPLSFGILFANLLQPRFSALLVLFTFFLQTQALFLLFLINTLPLFASALFILFFTLFTLLAPLFLFLLPSFLPGFIFFLLATSALLLLRSLLALPLALCL